MKAPIIPLVMALLLVARPAAVRLQAQAFNSGSNGSYGALDVTGGNLTLDVPADGVLHCTTITVEAGRTLGFRPNALNTPVYLLASGAVTIAGTINVDGTRGTGVAGGLGGPGGFAGGHPGSIGSPPGDGHGPGGGVAGTRTTASDGAGGGSYAVRIISGNSTHHGNTYGSPLLLPLVGGSGGGGSDGQPGSGGGGGGGALLIASNVRISITGGIRARGGSHLFGAYNDGSGGAVRLVAPVVAGNGTADVRAGEGDVNGGAGRIRVDALDRTQIGLTFIPESTASLGSMMIVFPTPVPRLDVVEAAGTPIADGSGPVLVSLPFGAPAAQTVKVRARDFSQNVPIRVVLTPDHGSSLSYDAEILNAAANPAEVSVNVEFPINAQTSVTVWTR